MVWVSDYIVCRLFVILTRLGQALWFGLVIILYNRLYIILTRLGQGLWFGLVIILDIGKLAFACNQQLCQMLDGSNNKGFQKIRTTEYCPKAVCTFENTPCKIKIRIGTWS